jgi:hypothetical protein
MNIGDRVVMVDSLGTIVGVSTDGLPIVEWSEDWIAHAPEELIVVEMPKPNEELDPSKDVE